MKKKRFKRLKINVRISAECVGDTQKIIAVHIIMWMKENEMK